LFFQCKRHHQRGEKKKGGKGCRDAKSTGTTSALTEKVNILEGMNITGIWGGWQKKDQEIKTQFV